MFREHVRFLDNSHNLLDLKVIRIFVIKFVPGSHRSARLNRPGFMKFLFLPAAGWDKSTNHVLCEECFASTLFEVHGRFNRGCTRQDFASCCVDWILLTLHQFRDFLTAIVQSRRFSFFSGEDGIEPSANCRRCRAQRIEGANASSPRVPGLPPGRF